MTSKLLLLEMLKDRIESRNGVYMVYAFEGHLFKLTMIAPSESSHVLRVLRVLRASDSIVS
jgi:hypothetical protein